MNSSKYLYCINDVSSEDFITTSFTYFLGDHRGAGYINIFNFNQNFDISRVKYAAIDYTLDPFVSFNKRYTNSTAIKIYSVEFFEQDVDRMTVSLLIIDNIESFDLLKYKRDLKIKNIINE